MKLPLLMKHIITTLAAFALIYATSPHASANNCSRQEFIGRWVDADCGCSSLAAACVGPAKKYNGGHWACNLGFPSGKTDCFTNLVPHNWKTEYPCVSEIDAEAALVCALALVVAATIGQEAIAVCFVAGVFVSTPACLIAMTAAAAGLYQVCKFCSMNNCEQTLTGATLFFENNRVAVGPNCPGFAKARAEPQTPSAEIALAFSRDLQ